MRSQKRSPTPVRTLADLAPDPKNANRGTARGREAVAHSVRAYGPGRAVLIDRHGRIVAGNKTVAAAKAAGLGLTVIESDGTGCFRHQVLVKRALSPNHPDTSSRF